MTIQKQRKKKNLYYHELYNILDIAKESIQSLENNNSIIENENIEK